MDRLRLVAVRVALLALRQTRAAGSEAWPQFRGLHAGVAVDDPTIPDTWSQTENIAWKLDVPGMVSPVVWDDHIFVTSVIGDDPIEKPHPGLYSDGERPTPTTPHRWMGTTSVSPPAQSAGSAGCIARSRPVRNTSRIPTPAKRRSPTASVSTPTSAVSACLSSIWQARRSGPKKWRRSRCVQAMGTRPLLPCLTTGWSS